ncbi:MAG: archease [Thermoanaerobaculia bacterium]|nr:archease [Thermoanaerobaculia bacterium]
MTLRELDHTADIGFEVEAPTLSELFREAAVGLARCISSEEGLEPREEHPVERTAASLEDLLVEWLEEQVFLCDTIGLLVSDVEAEVEESGDGFRVRGTLAGDRFDPDRHGLKVQVKAVTYHELEVENREGDWFARIIFDI